MTFSHTKYHPKLAIIPLVIAITAILLSIQVNPIETTSPSRELDARIEPERKNEYHNNKIEKKITIIVGDEEPTILSTNQSIQEPLPEVRKPKVSRTKPCNENVRETKHYVNETTKVIIIDEATEAGLIIGEIDTGVVNRRIRERRGSRGEGPETIRKVSANTDTATNYSLFIVSRHKNHVAILLDIEEIDFEPIINCEYQELRFEIVGGISNQLTLRKENSSFGSLINGEPDGLIIDQLEQAEPMTEDGFHSESDDQDSTANNGDDESIIPVSEAMAMLLNAPLNKTILGEAAESNDFKIIDSTIDFLYHETCKIHTNKTIAFDSIATNNSKFRHNGNHTNKNHSNGRSRRKQRSRGRQKNKSKRGKKDTDCKGSNKQFRDLFASKMEENFQWDDLKIVCGKTRQMIVPMRSLKLSVYSDEFAPNSRFVIRYRFISDASLLPTFDNGQYFCRNRNVIDIDLKCNGYDDCGDASDESVKVCGYPTNRNGELNTLNQATSSSSNINGSQSRLSDKKKLIYYGSELPKCCQSSDWFSKAANGQGSQASNLQSLIGESMKLFSGPLFAPTKQEEHRRFRRIVGGSVAKRGFWPGQVSLQYELLEPLCHFCAGTLIHPMYVLTAGHCITKDGLNRGIKVVFGAHDLRQLNGNHIQIRYVDDALIFPGVDVKHFSSDWENDMNNDIAILRLNAPVLITSQVAPACLPNFDTPLAINTTCRSIGWGQTHGSGSSNLLKQLPLKVVESSSCSKELIDRDNEGYTNKTTTADRLMEASNKIGNLKRGRFVSDIEPSNVDIYSNSTMICVNNDLGHGICQGDSGGPLYCDRVTPSGEHCTEIYGVASFIIQYATVGAMCAVENLPGIFGEVSSKTEWIASTIKMFEQSYRLRLKCLKNARVLHISDHITPWYMLIGLCNYRIIYNTARG